MHGDLANDKSIVAYRVLFTVRIRPYTNDLLTVYYIRLQPESYHGSD